MGKAFKGKSSIHSLVLILSYFSGNTSVVLLHWEEKPVARKSKLIDSIFTMQCFMFRKVAFVMKSDLN